MNTGRILTAALVAAYTLAAQQPAGGQKLIASDAKRLVSDTFGSDPKKAAAARSQLILVRAEDRKLILEAIAQMPFRPPATPCSMKVDGNVIDMTGDKLEAGDLLLNDEIVNLDQPVTIRLNGKPVSEAPVERSVEFLLDWYAKERDRGQLYWNRVRF